jgi:hypothetical protein
MRFPAVFALAVSLAPAAPVDVPAFFNSYCTACHGPTVQMATRRLDRITLPPKDDDTLILLQEALDQLNLGHMPPAKAKQPPAAQKAAVIATLTETITTAHAKRSSTGGHTVLRRLNRREYLNTIGDLFQLNMGTFDPTSKFPRDQTVHNMDNIGDALVTSSYLLEQYLDAAHQVVEKALDMRERPKEQSWTFNSNFHQQPELEYSHRAAYNFRYLCLYETTNTLRHEGAYAHIRDFAQGVPASGFYEIRVLAEAKNRHHPYDPKLFLMDPEEPFRLGIVPGSIQAGALHHSQPLEPQLGEVVVKDDTPEWHTFRVWLDQGFTPRFIFPNGMIDSRRAFSQIIGRYRASLGAEGNVPPGIVTARSAVLRGGKMPHIRMHEVQIRGPFYDQWPLPSQKAILGDKPFAEARTRELLERFATRAYRRPVKAEEMDRVMAIVERRRKDGKPAVEAFKDGLKAILSSPAFLYLPQPETAQLDAYALASRLSYFLWSTMPDEPLMAAARSKELLKPAVLLRETRRLLADGRAQNFVNGFLDSWLNLRSLGDMPPDRDAFEVFYAKDLQNAMRRETQMMTRHMLDRNEPLTRFLDADYSFLNKPLAKLYGIEESIPPEQAHVFRQMKLNNPNRGGLMGQGSVLTVSANGVETSPVTRGVWMLENIFGTPPAPPPDNVPPIDPDVRGAKSMREILTKHRESAACMACHQKIDPPGFALENFDPIGRWRAAYSNGVKIDSSGALPDGKAFTDVAGLKKLLLERKPQFTRMLTERLLTYACGRRMEPLDRPQISRIIEEFGKKGDGFRDLVEQAVISDVFRSR